MNPDAKIIFEKILAKDQSVLNGEERAFLRARRSYLNDEQVKRYADILKGTEATGDEDVDDLDAMGADALKKVAKGMDLAVGGSKEDIKARIREARASE